MQPRKQPTGHAADLRLAASVPADTETDRPGRGRPETGARRQGWASRPFLMALAMHLLLFLMLFVGVQWHREAPVAVQAELWSATAPTTASRTPEPKPEPEPRSKPEPEPEPAAVPKAMPERVETPREDPDIALQQRREREARERAGREAQHKAEEARRL